MGRRAEHATRPAKTMTRLSAYLCALAIALSSATFSGGSAEANPSHSIQTHSSGEFGNPVGGVDGDSGSGTVDGTGSQGSDPSSGGQGVSSPDNCKGCTYK